MTSLEGMARDKKLQWGPVVVTGISADRSLIDLAGEVLQWGPVVVTGISPATAAPPT